MKIHFSLTIQGKESIEQKLQESIQSNPTLHMDLIRAFGQSIMLALRLNESDNVSVSSFQAGVVDDSKDIEEKDKESG